MKTSEILEKMDAHLNQLNEAVDKSSKEWHWGLKGDLKTLKKGSAPVKIWKGKDAEYQAERMADDCDLFFGENKDPKKGWGVGTEKQLRAWGVEGEVG